MNRTEYDIKKCLLWAGILFLLVQPIQAAEWGTLSGQFIYNGKTDPKKVDESLVVGKNGGIKNIFVYLRNPKLKDAQIHSSYHKLPEKVVLNHQGSIYKPHASGLWFKQQKLIVINKDPFAHIFHIHPITNRNVDFDLKLDDPKKEQTYEYSLNEPIPVKIVCDIHPGETAYLLIKHHPYFAITDEKGAFTIKNLPVGNWKFQFWHEKAGSLNAKKEWKKGRIKIKIEPGKNDLGEIKVAQQLFEKK